MQLQVDGPVHLSDWHAEVTCSEGIIGGMKRHMAKRSESDVLNVLWTANRNGDRRPLRAASEARAIGG
jgi:hypothetical protein